MASLTSATEDAILDILFAAVAWANIADNTATSPLTNLYVSLHDLDPGDAGSQTTSETAYTN
ncbi:MAG: phage tail fiber protein, partial [Steroidobacteraceae bacterium]